MKKVKISDVTLREDAKNGSLSFKEKVNLVKKLDRLCVDIIETAKISNAKTDILFLHTIAPLLTKSIICCPVELSEESAETAYSALAGAKKFRLKVSAPVSSVQMEYLCGKKPDAMLEIIEKVIKKCASLCGDVEFSALDATRSEPEFLYKAVKTAILAGAKTVTVCDSAGEMMPAEYEMFIKELCKNVTELEGVTLAAECSNNLDMGCACLVAGIGAGVEEIKTSADGKNQTSLLSAARIFKTRGDFLGIYTDLNYTELEHTVSRLGFLKVQEIKSGEIFEAEKRESLVLSDKDDINTVSLAVKKLGYDLSDEDIKNVYEEFIKVARKKQITERELEVIVASAALQAVPIYKLKSYTINSGNLINASCVMTLLKDKEELQGVTVGDGPIDAAFQCIEQIAGRKFELDDFQIQSVTEGKEAVGVTVVKLRSNGKLYSGKGISTDIVESSINAYVNALNKICFEEA
ncbi:MAG: hypothetical protein K5768_06135 [Firmicutes bacterium]|nr:hypothetical protein [Bacillota bacterium]